MGSLSPHICHTFIHRNELQCLPHKSSLPPAHKTTQLDFQAPKKGLFGMFKPLKWQYIKWKRHKKGPSWIFPGHTNLITDDFSPKYRMPKSLIFRNQKVHLHTAPNSSHLQEKTVVHYNIINVISVKVSKTLDMSS